MIRSLLNQIFNKNSSGLKLDDPFDDRFVTIARSEDILKVHVKNGTKFGIREAYVTLLKRLEEKPYYAHRVLSTVGRNVSGTKKSRDFSASKEVGQFTVANAVMTKSRFTKIYINVFLKLVDTVYPVKFFTDVHKARLWLESFEDRSLDPDKVSSYKEDLKQRILTFSEN